jgi:microcystin-dependent protein
MANWTNPTLSSTYTNCLTEIKDRDDSAIKMMEGTTESNVATASKRYNTSNDKFERYNGSAWSTLPFHTPIDNHIANTALHTAPPAGGIMMWGTGVAPTGWLLCNGSAVSRSTYSALFAVIGSNFGGGDGSTTFNLPNFIGNIPIGLNSGVTAINTINKKTGSLDHTHSVGTHSHNVNSHAHGMKNHVHGQPGHAHSQTDHNHFVLSHYHDTRGAGATIAINSGGSHSHYVNAKYGGSDGSGSNRAQTASSSSGTNDSSSIVAVTSSNHSHSNGDITGVVGNGSSGRNGDADNQVITGYMIGAPMNTGSGGSDNTYGPSDNTSDAASTTTDSQGVGTIGTNNPPVMAINFIIKT